MRIKVSQGGRRSSWAGRWEAVCSDSWMGMGIGMGMGVSLGVGMGVRRGVGMGVGMDVGAWYK